jgi:Ribosomal RNA adenine dimethylase
MTTIAAPTTRQDRFVTRHLHFVYMVWARAVRQASRRGLVLCGCGHPIAGLATAAAPRGRPRKAALPPASLGVEGEDYVLVPWTDQESKVWADKAKTRSKPLTAAKKEEKAATRWQLASKGRNVKLKQSLSQHLLTDQGLLGYVVRQANVQLGEAVLEVGAGTGNLTQVTSLLHRTS